MSNSNVNTMSVVFVTVGHTEDCQLVTKANWDKPLLISQQVHYTWRIYGLFEAENLISMTVGHLYK